ncbi:MAG: HAMP domain-containing sensor histidine kinase, partial [Dehalococcoidia bacterium]
MLHSFRARLLAGFAIVIVMTLILSASAAALLLRDQQAEAAEARIGAVVPVVTTGVQQRELLGWSTQAIRAELRAAADFYDLRVMVLDDDARVVIDTQTGEPLLGRVLELSFTEPVDGRGGLSAFRTQRLNVDGDDLYLFTAGSSGADQSPALRRVVIAVPAGDVAGAWARLVPRLAVAGLAAAVVAVVFALLFASRITNPIKQMTRASEEMARGDLNQRIDVNGEDEVGRLAEAFNRMSSRISRSDHTMRDLLANVAHELRTPLTSIQGFSQAITDGVTNDPAEAAALINEEAERIRLLVDDLLYLSEIESGRVFLHLEQVDIDGLVEGAIRRLRLQAEERGVDLAATGDGGTVQAD